MNSTLGSSACRECSAPLASSADQCQECGGSLKPGWFCWACREFNQPDRTASCAYCGRLADSPAGWERLRGQKLAGALLFAVVGAVAAWSFIADVQAGRNARSTKDGEFSRQVESWSRGERRFAP